MRAGYYPRLAFEGIRKNRRLYVPYILTCVGMVMMLYIISFLAEDVEKIGFRGSETLSIVPSLGTVVIAVFSCIFLFYTNSFLVRRRKKEFGLYNILGMGKRNLSIIIFYETLMIAAISLLAGLPLGILFSKLAELLLLNILRVEVNYEFFVSFRAILLTSEAFGAIFLLQLLNSVRQVRFSTAINLLHSENYGEKPSKLNWLFGAFGAILLGGAYYIAVSIKNPVTALAAFTVAVIMVIIGTYLVMISGSVMFCQLLKKWKSYYYRPNRFVSVSSMVYRMKRNGAGLASICILATMVLVTVSSTTSLYFGMEDSLYERYPREMDVDVSVYSVSDLNAERMKPIMEAIDGINEKYGVVPENGFSYMTATVAGMVSGDEVETDSTQVNELDLTAGGLFQFYFVPLSEYNRVCGKSETLGPGEAMIYTPRAEYSPDRISFHGAGSFDIVKRLESFPTDGDMAALMAPTMVVVVPNLEDALGSLTQVALYTGDPLVTAKLVYDYDTGIDAEIQPEYSKAVGEALLGLEGDEYRVRYRTVSSREDDRQDFLGLYGGLFYLGIMLSAVFGFAAVLIIYYKQISEGYEDRSRFGIMRKVGMTDRDIRKSINSQLLTVFYLPLIFAGIHLLFAYPLIEKILTMLQLSNVGLFAAVTLICFAVFAVLYMLVYKITSNAYYNIVRGAKEERE